MNKKAYFYIDDTIWVLRDLTRMKPKSLFDTPLLSVLKKAHDIWGLKVQLNLFWRTDSFYGNDEFTLADVTDAYKEEFEEASDWLKFAFHAKEEFPDYPHVNATYKDVYDLFQAIKNEVIRFAGKNSFTYGTCPHWLPVSKEGVKALYDCGVRVMDATWGDTHEYNGDPFSLPYGHSARLLNNRQSEARVFSRSGPDVAIKRSICAHNHLSERDYRATANNMAYILDEQTQMKFKVYCSAMCINLIPLSNIESVLQEVIGKEFLGICNHEQYFYKDYFAYQHDYADRIYKMSEFLADNGYEFIFIGDEIK
ncbi:MAG: hypothetical protein E7395_01080 [Ruminococcaceae bacterium]|nr:hypothetical protein [Oscillospiraceae bacterium]